MLYRRYRYLNSLISKGQTETFAGPEVPDGKVLEVTSMAVSDCTTGTKLMLIGMLDQNDVLHPFEMANPARVIATRLRGTAWIEEGERPAGRVSDATANDVCCFSVHGKLWPKEEVGATGAKV